MRARASLINSASLSSGSCSAWRFAAAAPAAFAAASASDDSLPTRTEIDIQNRWCEITDRRSTGKAK